MISLGFDKIKYKCSFCNSNVFLYKFYDTNPKLELFVLIFDNIFKIKNIKKCKCGSLQIANDLGIRKKESLNNIEFYHYYYNDEVYSFKKNKLFYKTFPKKENKYKSHLYRKSLNFTKNIKYYMVSNKLSDDYFYDFCYYEKFDSIKYKELFKDYLFYIYC